MERTKRCVSLLAASLLGSLALGQSASGGRAVRANAPGFEPPAMAQLAGTSAYNLNTDEPPVRQFKGKIVSMAGVCVLKERHSKVLLQLDDQQEAHKYNGKAVVVTGMLNKPSETILVERIRPAASNPPIQGGQGFASASSALGSQYVATNGSTR
jgi:hypothetical protein